MSKYRATGQFEVNLSTLDEYGGGIGRMSLDKTYHGDLQATGIGEMLGVRGNADGSAVYVAMERIVGKLGGRDGSFALHHQGIMNRGAPTLSVNVVPDSGTDGLVGLKGVMNIVIDEQGRHSYSFEYDL